MRFSAKSRTQKRCDGTDSTCCCRLLMGAGSPSHRARLLRFTCVPGFSVPRGVFMLAPKPENSGFLTSDTEDLDAELPACSGLRALVEVGAPSGEGNSAPSGICSTNWLFSEHITGEFTRWGSTLSQHKTSQNSGSYRALQTISTAAL